MKGTRSLWFKELSAQFFVSWSVMNMNKTIMQANTALLPKAPPLTLGVALEVEDLDSVTLESGS